MASLPGILNGSPVMRVDMRVASALNRKCRHGDFELDCLSCKRAEDYEMGRIPYPVAIGKVVEPNYVNFGRHGGLQDLREMDGLRASTKIRWIIAELFPQIKLDDVIIDFHSNADERLMIWRGAAQTQFWVRLPRQTNREAFDYNQWVLPIEAVATLIEEGRKGSWKRKKVINVKDLM